MVPSNILRLITGINPSELQGISSPDEMAQFLLNKGRVNQQQVNQARQMWNDPQIQKTINNRFKY